MNGAKLYLLAIFTITCMALAFGTTLANITSPPKGTVTNQALIADDLPEDCYEEGNLICGDKEGVLEEQAWATWDAVGGWRYLKVDPNREFKVEYIGTAKMPPRLGAGEVALPSPDGGYWVFRAQYVEQSPRPTV